MVNNVVSFVKERKYQFRETDKEVQIDCPLCTDTRKRLGIRKDTEQWNCFNCSAKGRSLKTLKKTLGKLKELGRDKIVEFKNDKKVKLNQKLGPALYDALKKNKEAQAYMIQERGFSKECLEHFKIGARSKFKIRSGDRKGEKYDAGLHIALPYYEGETLVNVKYRAIDPKTDKNGNLMKWRREPDCKTSLFNYNMLSDHDFHEVYITESEIDCMTLWDNGIKNVVGLTAGAQGFQQEWRDLIDRFDNVYLILDNDKAGQEGAEDIARRVGMRKCYNVVLPEDTKDPNDFFKKYDSELFQAIVRKSKRFEPKNVTDLKVKLKDMISNVGKPSLEMEGLDTQWANINDVLGPVLPGNLITVAAKPKVGKCQKFDSTVINPSNMVPLTIEQAINNKMSHIHSYNEETKKIEVCKISDWIDSGVKPLVRVETKIGRTVETTYSHRYLTFDGWKFVSDIRIGEKIAVPTNLEFFGDNEMDLSKVHIIAALIADGTLNNALTYSKKDKHLINLMDRNLALFDCELNHIANCDYRIRAKKSDPNHVLEFVRELGMDCLSKHKTIPDEVFSLKKELLSEFIGMLWSHDGSITEKNGRCSIEYSSASEKLIDGLNHLLIRFGVNLRKRYKTAKVGDKCFGSWVLETSQAEIVANFLTTFPIYGEKSKRDYKISENMNRDYMTSYPKEMWDVVKSECDKQNTNMTQLWYSVIGYVPENYTGHRFKTEGCCSRAMLININKHLKSDLIKSFIESDISFVEVTKIEDIGKHQCYDLTVPKHANFISNDIVAHNTSWVMNWLYYLATKSVPTFNYQCEMEETDMVFKYGNMVMPLPPPVIPKVEYNEEGEPIYKDRAHQLEFVAACDDRKTWFRSVALNLPTPYLKSYHPRTTDLLDDADMTALDKVCAKIEEVVDRFGCKVVVFDNLHFLCRGDKAKEQIDRATRRFKLLAKDLQVVFILVTHPRKTNHNRPLTNDDLKDSASIFQDSDAIILMHRAYLDHSEVEGLGDDEEDDDGSVQEGALDTCTEFKITARRHKGGNTVLDFYDERVLFTDKGQGYIDMLKKRRDKANKKKKR